MSSVEMLSSVLSALPGESYFVLPPGFAAAAVKLDDGSFLLACVPPLSKDGYGMGNCVHYAVQRYRSLPLLSAMEKEDRATEKEVTLAIGEAVIESDGAPPSIDAILFAYLFSLPGVNFVLQGGSIAVNQILCSPRGREFAKHRILPEEAVACGVSSLYVPYADAGLPLAQAVRLNFEAHKAAASSLVKVILLQNRGSVVLGRTSSEVLRSYFTLEKAAQVWMGAALLGGPTFLTAPSLMKLMQMPENAHHPKLQELSLQDHNSDRKQILNFPEGTIKDDRSSLSYSSMNREASIDPSEQEKSLAVRPEIPLFDEDKDKGGNYSGKLSFARRTPSNRS
jgi:hypothetical protein